MAYVKGSIAGLIFGVIGSMMGCLLFVAIAGTYAGGSTSVWDTPFYLSLVVPFTLSFVILGNYTARHRKISSKKLWVISLIIAFTVTLYTGTIGAIFGEYIIHGDLQTTNVQGIIEWGFVFSFLSLPVTIPVSRLVIQFFILVLEEYKVLD
ncbi:hypothetical protein [Domibacillus robiginosus]|uniref:hypothetical protein n=1 Tax=Domibacillus robiginosus TaxID=1071054 RepID=UPI00067B0E4F|nr:hypothetical protein [Domibacillus robiginosus]